jgi:hypothetical protein
MTNIPTGRIGKILSGEECGLFIKVISDHDNTGGFLILTGDDKDLKNCFDSWVENELHLEQYFLEAGWLVEWL